MQKEKKRPERKCLGCNEMKDKRELIRVVKNNANEIFLDLTGKANGRGAYVCPNSECFLKAKKAKRLERAFQAKIPDEIYDRLESEMKDHEH